MTREKRYYPICHSTLQQKEIYFFNKCVIDTTNAFKTFFGYTGYDIYFYRLVLFFSHDPVCVVFVLQISSKNSRHHEC
jgi:hypothetical protein